MYNLAQARWRLTMNKIGAFEAKNKLGELLDRVEKGEEIVVPAMAGRWLGSFQ